MSEHENLYDQVNAEIEHDYDPPPDDDKPTLAECQADEHPNRRYSQTPDHPPKLGV